MCEDRAWGARDRRPRREWGPSRGSSQPPTFPEELEREGRASLPPRARCGGRSQLWAHAWTSRAAPSLCSLVPGYLGSLQGHLAGPARPSLARSPCVSPARCPGNRPLSRQPPLSPLRPSGASCCSRQPGAQVPTLAFAHFRLRPRGRAGKGQQSAGLVGPWREGRPFGVELALGTHPQLRSSVAGRLKLQPPACLAAAGGLQRSRSPRRPIGVGVHGCSEA